MTNRDKFNGMNNSELADILNGNFDDSCKFCTYTRGDCFGKNCVEGIERWLNAPCEDEPENPPDNSNEIDVIDFIEDKGLDYCLGKAVIHISTGQSVKNLQKSIWYINKKIQSLERVGNDK